MNTKPVVQIEISKEASTLPQLAGSGRLRDLRSAMTLDSTLLSMVESFSATPSSVGFSNLKASVTAIIYQWAGVSNVASNARGSEVDARQLEFVEKYLGKPFYNDTNGASESSNPYFRAAADINAAWTDLYDAVFARLITQTPGLAGLIPEFRFDVSTDTIQATSSLAPALAAAFQRLGDVTNTNLSSWELVLRVADAARMDMGISESLFKDFADAATSNTVASIAYAIASGHQVTVDTSGRIEIIGSKIDDVLYAAPGIGLLVGNGGGNNQALQQLTNDTFVYAAGDGKLEIKEIDSDGVAPTNTLQFAAGINPSAIVARVNSGDVVITDGVSGDQITLDGEARRNSLSGVQFVKFADGTTWTMDQLQRACTLGTTADDKLYGVLGGDVFDGKGGNDYAAGVGGGDTFIFNAGYGKLEISESDSSSNPHNVLKLGPGISASSITVRSTGNNLILTDAIAGDQITLDGTLTNSAYGVQTVQFADGTTLTRQQLLQMEMTGTAGNETIWGTSGADIIDGKAGNDMVYGGGGGDTFIFNAGYGKLEISESDSSSNPHNVLKLGPGISASSITVRSTGNNLILTDAIAGDQITLDGTLTNSAYGVQTVQFADGTTLTRQQLIAMASGQAVSAVFSVASQQEVCGTQAIATVRDSDEPATGALVAGNVSQMIESMASMGASISGNTTGGTPDCSVSVMPAWIAVSSSVQSMQYA
jgi:Ca2+-binding RTX toxin-like protein